MRLKRARAGTPTTFRSIHLQGFMRTQGVVFPAKIVEPGLLFGLSLSLADGALESAMHTLHLALGLRMAKATKGHADALPHDPHRQFGPAPQAGAVPPGRSMIHQHGFRQSV